MVLSFFRGAESALDHVENEVVVMIGSCRHSFDLAMAALVSDADIAPMAEEVRATDERVNAIEESVRRELVVHSAVSGGQDVGAVLGLLLIVKKLERVGDQCKNILNLAEQGVRFSGADDYEQFAGYRARVSAIFGRVQEALGEEEPPVAELVTDVTQLMNECEEHVNELLHASSPASYAVPRAMLYRYLKRTVANLLGAVVTLAEGVDRPDGQDLDE